MATIGLRNVGGLDLHTVRFRCMSFSKCHAAPALSISLGSQATVPIAQHQCSSCFTTFVTAAPPPYAELPQDAQSVVQLWAQVKMPATRQGSPLRTLARSTTFNACCRTAPTKQWPVCSFLNLFTLSKFPRTLFFPALPVVSILPLVLNFHYMFYIRFHIAVRLPLVLLVGPSACLVHFFYISRLQTTATVPLE